MKKWIIYGTDKWAKALLTLERLEKIDYFIKDDNEPCEPVFADGFQGRIKSLDCLLEEKKDEILVIISNSRKYEAKAKKLKDMGFVENIHFFNGWKLDNNFYSVIEANQDWIMDENQNPNIFENAAWERRAKMMAAMIPDDVRTIMDLGCGDCKLKKYLSAAIKYIGLDYCKRDKDTIICDMNRDKLPAINVDMYYLGGVLPYITDKEKLFRQMKEAKYILLSAYPMEQFIRLDGFVFEVPSFSFQNYSNDDMINYLYKTGFVLVNCKYDYKVMNAHFYLFQRINTINKKEKQ